MRYLNKLHQIAFIWVLAIALYACSTEQPNTPQNIDSEQPSSENTSSVTEETSEAAPSVEQNSGDLPYPAPDSTADPSYPGPEQTLPENASSEPPNPTFDLLPAANGFGNVGGILVESIEGDLYVPFKPVELKLSPVIQSSSGELAYIRSGSEDPRAQLFDTGVFIFTDVPPNTYGLVASFGIGEVVIQDDNGEPILYVIEEGEIYDLGQIIIDLN